MVYLYPEAHRQLPGVPSSVEKAYSSALKVKNIDANAFAVLIGRTLEAICHEEQVTGPNLAARLKKLSESGRIPDQLAKMASQLKEIRNLGAHFDAEGDEITLADVPIVIDFIAAILEYLYVAPAKITALEVRLKKSKKPE